MSAQPLAEGDNLFTGFTRLCKGISVVLAAGCVFVNVVPSSLNYLALIPAKTIPFAWNLVTAGYIEKSVIGVVISILGLLFFGKLLEPVWGSREFLKFVVVVNFFTSLCTFATAVVLYIVTKKENHLYAPVSGFHGVLVGFLVGIKQLVPDQELPLLSRFTIKAKWIPSLVLIVSIALSFFITDSASNLPTMIYGTYTSWIYLRYLEKKSDANVAGDQSDEFAFSTFFPEVLQYEHRSQNYRHINPFNCTLNVPAASFCRPSVDRIASVLDHLLCRRSVNSRQAKQAKGHTLGGTPSGSDPVEISRRRERGARALEERLAAQRSADPSSAEFTHKDATNDV